VTPHWCLSRLPETPFSSSRSSSDPTSGPGTVGHVAPPS
jgi:hypothetical protein